MGCCYFDCAVPVRGVAAVSLLLFSLCVDGLLVCVEACTQVTGVMAMMMTGRVLLVCALCVLWCGAGGGGCSETSSVPENGKPREVTIPTTGNQSIDGTEGGDPTGNNANLQAQPLAEQAPAVAVTVTTNLPVEQTTVTEKAVVEDKQKKDEKKGDDDGDKEEEDEEEVDEDGEDDESEDHEEGEEDDEEKEGEEEQKIIPAPPKGCQQAVKNSQFCHLVRREHRIKQISTALKSLAAVKAAPRSPAPPPVFCFLLLRVRLLLLWCPRESEGERVVHRPHTHSSFSLSVCVSPCMDSRPHLTPRSTHIMCPLYICMHTHAGPLVLSFAPHAPLPSCLPAWAGHR
ncbi:hypothetical protein MOQ_007403, partial [Trypanosoma cruzi marinkellei]